MKRTRLVVSPKRAALLAAMIILCAVPAVLMNTLPGYLCILFVLFLCLISLIYGFAVFHSLTCEGLSGTESCLRSESVPVSLRITNASRLVCTGCHAEFYTTDVFGRVRTTESLGFTLSPRETRQFGFDVSLDHVGRFTVGLRSLRAEGLLGVVSFERELSFAGTVTVLPRSHVLGQLALSEAVRSESLYANRVSTADSIDYSGVREYSIGDPIKLIHWNLSSHSGSYMTKLLESYGNNSLTVIPFFRLPKVDAETAMEAYDCIAECCASLSEYAKRLGMDAELLAEDNEGKICRRPLQNPEDLAALLPGSGEGNSCEPLERMLHQEAGNRYSASNLTICTSALSEFAAKQLIELKRRMKTVVLFYARPYGMPEQTAEDRAIKTLRAADIELYILSSADEIGKDGAL